MKIEKKNKKNMIGFEPWLVSSEIRMNPVTIAIIIPWNEIGRAGDRTSDLLFSSPVGYRLR